MSNKFQTKNIPLSPKVIWVNYPWEDVPADIIGIFPNSKNELYRLSHEQIVFLVNNLSDTYAVVISALAKLVSERLGLEIIPTQTILREPVVLLIYFIVDRMLRLQRIVDVHGAVCLEVADSPNIDRPSIESDLINFCNNSKAFNQHLLSKLAPCWGLKVADKGRLDQVYKSNIAENLTFNLPGPLKRIRHKLFRLISNKFGYFPCLSIANIEIELLDKNVYGFLGLGWLNWRSIQGSFLKNIAMRTEIKSALIKEIEPELFNIFSKIDFRGSNEYAAEIFVEFLIDNIPAERLEGSVAYKQCEERIRGYPGKRLLFCSMPASQEIYWIAAAKKNKILITGVQHGAHYGFSNQSCHTELEYSYCDEFITWGWKQLPSVSMCKNIKLIPLTSPWLSERKKKWRKGNAFQLIEKDKIAYDVLWMTDRLQVFPPTLSTLRMSRLDYLPDIDASMREIVFELVNRDIRILHKPFDYISRDIQQELLEFFSLSYSTHYNLSKNLDKGLTRELLDQTRIVLWDEPGTGFFECLVSEIPTMIVWSRLTSSEEPYAKEIFSNLEAVGIMHKNGKSLAIEVEKFLAEPNSWLNDRKRVNAVGDAIKILAYVDSNWEDQWKSTIHKWRKN